MIETLPLTRISFSFSWCFVISFFCAPNACYHWVNSYWKFWIFFELSSVFSPNQFFSSKWKFIPRNKRTFNRPIVVFERFYITLHQTLSIHIQLNTTYFSFPSFHFINIHMNLYLNHKIYILLIFIWIRFGCCHLANLIARKFDFFYFDLLIRTQFSFFHFRSHSKNRFVRHEWFDWNVSASAKVNYTNLSAHSHLNQFEVSVWWKIDKLSLETTPRGDSPCFSYPESSSY